MLIQGVRDFSIHGAKKTASTNRADGSCGNHTQTINFIILNQ